MHKSRDLSGTTVALAYTPSLDEMVAWHDIPQDAVKNIKPNALPLLSEGW